MAETPQGAGPYVAPPEAELQPVSYEETAKFWKRFVPPPSALYLTLDDALFITDFGIVSGLSILVRGRVLRADGGISRFVTRFLTNGGANGFTRIFPLCEGYLLDVSVMRDTSSTVRGSVFVQVALGRGLSAAQEFNAVLISGYVTGVAALGWPNSTLYSPTDGQGRIYRFNSAAPGAGADWSITVPSGVRWRVQSVRATLVTSATVANRTPQITLDDGATAYFQNTALASQVASTTIQYEAAPGVTTATGAALYSVICLPVNAVIEQGHRISAVTIGIQAADQWSLQSVLVEEWVSPL